MLAYRDQVVASLKAELNLLSDLKNDQEIDFKIDDAEYKEKAGIISGEIKKLNNFDVVLTVVGTVKAGKSTTINAIVGHEILPNRSRPMTALPTLIYHDAKQTEPLLTFNNPAVNKLVASLKTQLSINKEWKELCQSQAKEIQQLTDKIIAGWTFETEYHGARIAFSIFLKI